jgi:hypothetical protein
MRAPVKEIDRITGTLRHSRARSATGSLRTLIA